VQHRQKVGAIEAIEIGAHIGGQGHGNGVVREDLDFAEVGGAFVAANGNVDALTAAADGDLATDLDEEAEGWGTFAHQDFAGSELDGGDSIADPLQAIGGQCLKFRDLEEGFSTEHDGLMGWVALQYTLGRLGPIAFADGWGRSV
jgi:hypothetical protein